MTSPLTDRMASPNMSVDGITADFPKPILTKNAGDPNREHLILLYKELAANAASVPSNLGGGNHGHLALMLSEPNYLAQTGNSFVLPHNPGDFAP